VLLLVVVLLLLLLVDLAVVVVLLLLVDLAVVQQACLEVPVLVLVWQQRWQQQLHQWLAAVRVQLLWVVQGRQSGAEAVERGSRCLVLGSAAALPTRGAGQ
jgi:hypothetical protein